MWSMRPETPGRAIERLRTGSGAGAWDGAGSDRPRTASRIGITITRHLLRSGTGSTPPQLEQDAHDPARQDHEGLAGLEPPDREQAGRGEQGGGNVHDRPLSEHDDGPAD